MKIAVVFLLLAIASASSLGATLEGQFRSDFERILRESWRADQITPEALSRTINEIVSEFKVKSPWLLEDQTSEQIPSSAEIEKMLAEIVRIDGREPNFGLFTFYLKWWKAKQMNPKQVVILARLLKRYIDTRPKAKSKA